MTFDKLLVLLIAPACKITFAVEHFKCGSGKSFMSSIVAPQKNPDFKTEFSFALDSLNYELELKKMGIWLQQVAKT